VEDETDPGKYLKMHLGTKDFKISHGSSIPAASATAERVFSFAGLTLSNLRKSLLEGTLEAIMWTPKWGSPGVAVFLLVEVIFT
jgi:hypothetical protein